MSGRLAACDGSDAAPTRWRILVGVDLTLTPAQLELQARARTFTGEVLQPSEVLYKKPVLVERGSFRPVTHVNVDMLECALDPQENSRLSCQIRITPQTDGLVVRLPRSQV